MRMRGSIARFCKAPVLGALFVAALAALDLQAAMPEIEFETKPRKIAESSPVKVSRGADFVSFDLREAFNAGAKTVTMIVNMDVPQNFKGRPAAFIGTFDKSGESPAKMRIITRGYRKGNVRWDTPLSRRFPVNVITNGRAEYGVLNLLPEDIEKIDVWFEFSKPGDGELRFYGLDLGDISRLDGKPDDIGEKPRLLLHAKFDGVPDAQTKAGDVKPVVAEGISFAEGRVGKAVRFSRPSASRLAYAAKGVADPLRGSVSFWAKTDAKGKAQDSEGLFALSSGANPAPGDGALTLYLKNGPSGARLKANMGWKRGDWGDASGMCEQIMVPHDNAWHHFIFTWSERRCRCYVDGLPMKRILRDDMTSPLSDLLRMPPRYKFRDGLADRLSKMFVGGADGVSGGFDGMIDDFRVWSAPMTPKQASRYYAQASGGTAADADGVWGAPWRNPQTPPPPNVALLPPGEEAGVPSGMELLDDVRPAELARAGDSERFLSRGKWRIGTLDGEEYLETGPKCNDRFAVRFRLDPSVQLYCFEVTYPDDKTRTMDLTVQNSAIFYSDWGCQAGVETGIEHPLTHKNAVKRLLYWPRPDGKSKGAGDDFALIAMTAGLTSPAPWPAAVTRIRVFAIRSAALPSAKIVPAPPVNGRTRHFALRYEDPSVKANFGVGQLTLEQTRLSTDRLAAYLKFIGADTFIYPGVWYSGPIGRGYQPRIHAPHYLREFCRRFDRDGISFYASINQQQFPDMEIDVSLGGIGDGSLHATPLSILSTGLPNWGGWHFTPNGYNIAHPKVQEALADEVQALVDECAAHKSFKGVCLDLFNAINVGWWGSLENGYNDYNIAAFEKATGVKVPVDRKDPMRGKAYAKWLKANAYDKWVQWRCDVVTDFYRRLAALVRAKRPDLELWVSASPLWQTAWDGDAMWERPDLSAPDVANRMLRESGIDAAKLAAIPNLSLGILSIPCLWRDGYHKQPGPQKALRSVCDLPETPGFYEPVRRTAYPFAMMHDSYYENGIGDSAGAHGDGGLAGKWLKETRWRVTAFNASGREALRPFAKALAYGDMMAFAKGGYLVGTLGMEDVLAPFMQHFRALPAVMFSDVPGNGRGDVRLRTAKTGGRTWYYAVNTGFDPASVALPEGLADAVTGERLGRTISLSGYELRAMVESGTKNANRR